MPCRGGGKLVKSTRSLAARSAAVMLDDRFTGFLSFADLLTLVSFRVVAGFPRFAGTLFLDILRVALRLTVTGADFLRDLDIVNPRLRCGFGQCPQLCNWLRATLPE